MTRTGEPYTVNDVIVITLKPNSTVQIQDSVDGNKTGAWPLRVNGEYYGQYPRGVYLTSGNVSDWPKTIFGNDEIGLFVLSIKKTEKGKSTDYFIRIAE